MVKEKKYSWLFTIIMTITLALFILSASISVPLVCRPFYYAHIDGLHLPEETGYTKAEIKEAFDEMMDFCMKGEPFGTGVMKWSEEGKAHFEDCAVLFHLDLWILRNTAAILIALAFFSLGGWRPKRLWNRGPFFWSGCGLIGAFALITGWAALDFYRAFVMFHKIFFPGKSNWLFDYDVDQIINVLPEVFFRNCAILVVGLLFLMCILSVVIDGIVRRKAVSQNV